MDQSLQETNEHTPRCDNAALSNSQEGLSINIGERQSQEQQCDVSNELKHSISANFHQKVKQDTDTEDNGRM